MATIVDWRDSLRVTAPTVTMTHFPLGVKICSNCSNCASMGLSVIEKVPKDGKLELVGQKITFFVTVVGQELIPCSDLALTLTVSASGVITLAEPSWLV